MTTPTRGQIYTFPDYDGNPARLVIVSVNDTHIEYKFLNENGSLGRYTYPMVRTQWNKASENVLTGTMLVPVED